MRGESSIMEHVVICIVVITGGLVLTLQEENAGFRLVQLSREELAVRSEVKMFRWKIVYFLHKNKNYYDSIDIVRISIMRTRRREVRTQE